MNPFEHPYNYRKLQVFLQVFLFCHNW